MTPGGGTSGGLEIRDTAGWMPALRLPENLYDARPLAEELLGGRK
ncbi:MAG TPA: hypothetical protein VN829_05490 [Dongiaceae bacterium]|nr:hypothetical protein [Dongiaceae bacterium]